MEGLRIGGRMDIADLEGRIEVEESPMKRGQGWK